MEEVRVVLMVKWWCCWWNLHHDMPFHTGSQPAKSDQDRLGCVHEVIYDWYALKASEYKRLRGRRLAERI